MDKAFHRFFKRIIPSCFLAVAGFVLLAAWLDVFGLFGMTQRTRVYGEERISKYLMAFRYIPENFDGIILGPSLSANLNPGPISDVRYFNASLMGARIQTMVPLLEQVLASDHRMRKAWICLHPYMTQQEGVEQHTLMRPSSYWSAFGSIHLLRVYGFALLRWLRLAPGKYPPNQYLENGTNQFEPLFRVPNVAAKIEAEKALVNAGDFEISPVAEQALNRLWQLLESHHIETTVYFHPVPLPIRAAHAERFRRYWEEIKASCPAEGSWITFENFNQPKYDFFSSDTTNYIDHGHLSTKGQKRLLEELNRISR